MPVMPGFCCKVLGGIIYNGEAQIKKH